MSSHAVVLPNVNNKEGKHVLMTVATFLVLILLPSTLLYFNVVFIQSFLVFSHFFSGDVFFFLIQGHLDEKEEEVLMMAVTEGEMRIAYHPNLEQLPPLSRVLEKVEFLAELEPKDRQR